MGCFQNVIVLGFLGGLLLTSRWFSAAAAEAGRCRCANGQHRPQTSLETEEGRAKKAGRALEVSDLMVTDFSRPGMSSIMPPYVVGHPPVYNNNNNEGQLLVYQCPTMFSRTATTMGIEWTEGMPGNFTGLVDRRQTSMRDQLVEVYPCKFLYLHVYSLITESYYGSLNTLSQIP